MDKKTWRTGEQRPGPRDLKIGKKTRWRKFYREKKDVRYIKVWKTTERKEGHVNKKQVQEIVLSRIVVKDESTDRNKVVIAQRDDGSTNEDDDEYTSEHELFWAIRLKDSQVTWILDRGEYMR